MEAIFKRIAEVNGSTSGRTFEIPYSVLLRKRNEVTHLLVPVCHTVTHIAFATTRVEPHFMLLDGAAGYAAAYSILDENINVQAVSVSRIQDTLTKDGVPLHYPKEHCDE